MGHTVVPPLEVDVWRADGRHNRCGSWVVEMTLLQFVILFLPIAAVSFWAGYEHGRHVEVDRSLRTVKKLEELVAQTEQRLRERLEAKGDGYSS